jgi:iron-sulfur cluster repair protein YtfE (RIC family)
MSQNPTTTHQDAIELLTSDHAEVEQMFRQVESSPEGDTKDQLVRDIVRELSVHAVIEEQILYPAMRRALHDGDALVDEAIAEHQEAKELLSDIEKSSTPAEREPLLRQLMPSIRHHVQEEEGELFPKLRTAIDGAELQEMGAELASAKKMAPTHPHPKAPNQPPGNVVAGAVATVMDKARDAIRRD